LAHHSRRMRSPAFIITHHDATTLPMLPAEDGKTSTGFDRILCDVPCTGDGTMRKAPHLWKKWSPAGGIGLHPLQLRIALRAARLLRVGGDMCYSTCSLNPLENEAVVAELVRCCGGSLQIVDVSDRLPELQRWPGLTEWRVMTPDHKFFTTHDEALAARKTTCNKGFFAPPKADGEAMGLPHCLRLVPHLQDTGGFFVCILRKLAELPEDAESKASNKAARGVKRPAEDSVQEPDKEAEEVAAALAAQEDVVINADLPAMIKEDPFHQLIGGEVTNGTAVAAQLQSFYQLEEAFPMHQLFSRSTQGGRLVLVSPAILHLLQNDPKREFKAINSGARVFEKCNFMSGERGCQLRLVQEGVHLVAPFMKARNVPVSIEDFTLMAAKKSVKLTELSCEDTKTTLMALEVGSLVLRVALPDSQEVLYAVAERGEAFVQLFVDKDETRELLRRVCPEHPSLQSGSSTDKAEGSAPAKESAPAEVSVMDES